MKRGYCKDALAIGAVLIASLWAWRPLINQPAERISNDYDGAFVAWVLSTVAEKLTTGDLHGFWQGPIFYPFPWAMTFSDSYLPSAIAALPVWWLTHEPVAVLNLSTLLAVSLTALMLFFLLHELTDDRAVSGCLAVVLTTSPIYLHYSGHLHTLQLSGVVLALLSLVKLSKQWQNGWLFLWSGAWVGQTANNFLTGMMIVVATGIYCLFDRRLRRSLWRHRRVVGVTVTLASLSLLPVISPYLAAVSYYGSHRPIQDVMHFSLSVDDLWQTFFSPLVLLLFFVGLFRIGQKQQWAMIRTWLWLGGAGLVMALGPALKWAGRSVKFFLAGDWWHIPLPYTFFYFLVPGFQGFRTPSRWLVLVLIAAIIVAAIGIAQLRRPWRLMVLWLTSGWLLSRWPLIPTVPIPAQADYPEVYQWLKRQPDGVVLELPIFTWGSDAFSKNETWRMLYQTLHGKTLVNGYSGYSPPEWEALVKRMHDSFPSTQALTELQSLGVDYIVVHHHEYRKWRGDDGADLAEWGLRPQASSSGTTIYSWE